MKVKAMHDWNVAFAEVVIADGEAFEHEYFFRELFNRSLRNAVLTQRAGIARPMPKK